MSKISRRLVCAPILSQIARLLVSFQNFMTRFFVTGEVSARMNMEKYVRLGTEYGGWWIARSDLVQRDRGKVLISAGIGFDVSFDLKLAEDDFELVCIDPLTESIDFAKIALSSVKRVEFYNVGLADSSGKRTFYPPRNASHDSWSLIDIQNGDSNNLQEFETIGLSDMLINIERSNKFVYLKMDIEGAEKEVLESLIEKNLEVDFLAVEMDYISLIPFFAILTRIREVSYTRALLKRMSRQGYHFIGNDGFNFFWSRT